MRLSQKAAGHVEVPVAGESAVIFGQCRVVPCDIDEVFPAVYRHKVPCVVVFQIRCRVHGLAGNADHIHQQPESRRVARAYRLADDQSAVWVAVVLGRGGDSRKGALVVFAVRDDIVVQRELLLVIGHAVFYNAPDDLLRPGEDILLELCEHGAVTAPVRVDDGSCIEQLRRF